MNHRNLTTISSIATLLALSGQAHGQLIMTDATFTAPTDNQRGLASFEIDNGGVTYFPSALASYVSGTLPQDEGWNLGQANTTGQPSSPQAAMEDAFVTTNVFALRNNTIFSLNTTVNDGDGAVFFLAEHLGNDNNINVTPLDASNQPIGTWVLDLDGADYAAITTTAIYDYENQGNPIAATTFTLSDFTGGTGTLTGVAALEIDGDQRLDLALLGVATIPEPSTYAMLAGLIGMLAVLRRRR